LITFQSHPYSFRLKLFKIRTHDLKNIPFYLEVKDKNPIFAIVFKKQNRKLTYLAVGNKSVMFTLVYKDIKCI